MLTLVTAPTVEPINLPEAKLHLRVEHTADDVLIDTIICAARMVAENATERALCTQTWALKADCLDEIVDSSGAIPMPKAPLQSVTHLKYRDTNGALQTWDPANYQVDAPTGPRAEPGRLARAYGVTWPTVRSETLNAIEIQYVAGYGQPNAVPQLLKQAMLLVVGHLYENRETVALIERGQTAVEIPLSAQWIFQQFDARRFQ